MVGFIHQCPLIRFRGRSDLVADLVGEKLAEPFVRGLLLRSGRLRRLRPIFMMLVPIRAVPPRYRLYLQAESIAWLSPELEDLCDELQASLGENPYYRQAVGMGQLAPMELTILDPEGESAWQLFERHCLELGRKLGDIKPAALDRWAGWQEVFASLTRATATARTPSAIPTMPAGAQ